MPKIEYVQDAVNGLAGDVVEVGEVEATALIAMGFAKAFEDVESVSKTRKTTKAASKKDD